MQPLVTALTAHQTPILLPSDANSGQKMQMAASLYAVSCVPKVMYVRLQQHRHGVVLTSSLTTQVCMPYSIVCSYQPPRLQLRVVVH
jgi:hypothetical protein